MPDIVNPYIAGNPVTGAEMFFGRDDVFTFVQQALTGQHRDNVIVLYGQRRTGKTSVLYQMHRHLDPRYLCIFIDLHGLALEGLNGFLWELAGTISRALRKDYQIDVPRPANRNEFLADARSSFENDFLNQVWTAIGERHLLLMLDEAIRLQEQIQAGKLEKEIFEYLRHLMQHFDRLNFLFSLGSGLEEMEKEYAFLFSVGLYKRISLLEREAAIALITRPARDCYQVEPAAINRILQITSGHAYYTQLVCHSLFNRWQQDHQMQIAVKDVDAILDEVVERGLAVLKHVWEDSAPGEKAVLAGLATTMGERNRPIGPQEIDRAWEKLDVVLPGNERSKAIKSLIARDVIAGQDKYGFAIELQRLWTQKYERLEWVKEEIANDIQQWRSQPGAPPTPRSFWRSKAGRITAAVGIGLILALVLLIFQIRGYLSEVNNRAIQFGVYARTLEAQGTRTALNLFAAQAAATGAANAPAPTATALAQQLLAAQIDATAAAKDFGATATAKAAGLCPTTLFYDALSGKCVTEPPPDTPTLAPTPTPAPCTKDSRFLVDVTVPDGTQFSPGTPFIKTWRLLNTGSCAWNTSYQLFLYRGDQMGGPASMALPRVVNQHEFIELSVPLIAPTAPGTYQGMWQLRDPNGAAFGYRFIVQIVVAAGTPTSSTSGSSLIVIASRAVNLLDFAPTAIWSNGSEPSGFYLDIYPDANAPHVERGYVAYVPPDRVLAKTGPVGSRQVLATHPPSVSQGQIIGSFHLQLPVITDTFSGGIELYSTVEFLAGASQSDSVHVEIWWLDDARGNSPGKKLREVDINRSDGAANLVADLTNSAGQSGELRIIVNAQNMPSQDWLTWTALVITPK